MLLGVLGAVALIVAVAAYWYVAVQNDPAHGTGDPNDDLARLRKIDPARIGYEPAGEIPVGLAAVHALAVGPDDTIYVAGDRAIRAFDAQGRRIAEISLERTAQCLAIGGKDHAFPGRIYVGTANSIDVFDADGRPVATWDDLGTKAQLTSLAVAENDVFAADAGNRVVWRFDVSGKIITEIGRQDERRGVPGFAIPSPYFDVAMGHDGLLRVVNPGALRIEAYTFDGDLEQAWPRSDDPLAGFFGCCNPAHLAIMDDGRCVTAEKALPRVKVHTLQGELITVVSGPEQLDVEAVDLAVDGQGRVLVLDPNEKCVRIFEPKTDPIGANR